MMFKGLGCQPTSFVLTTATLQAKAVAKSSKFMNCLEFISSYFTDISFGGTYAALEIEWYIISGWISKGTSISSGHTTSSYNEDTIKRAVFCRLYFRNNFLQWNLDIYSIFLEHVSRRPIIQNSAFALNRRQISILKALWGARFIRFLTKSLIIFLLWWLFAKRSCKNAWIYAS